MKERVKATSLSPWSCDQQVFGNGIPPILIYLSHSNHGNKWLTLYWRCHSLKYIKLTRERSNQDCFVLIEAHLKCICQSFSLIKVIIGRDVYSKDADDLNFIDGGTNMFVFVPTMRKVEILQGCFCN